MNLYEQRDALKAAVATGAMPREVADKIVASQRPDAAAVRITSSDGDGEAGDSIVVGGEMFLYGRIDPFGGVWGISANEVRAGLDQLGDAEELTVRINSPGGAVLEGIAIHNMLADHPARVTVMVDGAAYSIASAIAMAGDRIVVNRGGEFMVHEARVAFAGTAPALRSMADRLDRASAMTSEIYAARAGGSADEWRERMKAETWLYADEAVELGLADEAVALKTKPDTGSGSEPAALWDAALFGKNADHPVGEDSTGDVGPDAGGESAATAAGDSARLRASRVVAGMKLRQVAAGLSQL